MISADVHLRVESPLRGRSLSFTLSLLIAGSLAGAGKKSSKYVPSFLPPSMAAAFGKEEKAGQQMIEVDSLIQSQTIHWIDDSSH